MREKKKGDGAKLRDKKNLAAEAFDTVLRDQCALLLQDFFLFPNVSGLSCAAVIAEAIVHPRV